jgi:hypothetical protein
MNMSPVQRSLYFIAVCAGILAVGVLILTFGYKEAHAAELYVQGDVSTTTAVTAPNDGNTLWYNAGSFIYTGPTSVVRAISVVRKNDIAFQNSIPIYFSSSTPAISDATPLPNCHSSGVVNLMDASQPLTRQTISFVDNNGNTCTLVSGATYYISWGGSSTLSTHHFTFAGTPTVPVFQLFDSTTTPAATSIQIISPTNGTTTPSTTLTVDANYTIGSDLGSFALNGNSPNRIGLNLSAFSNSAGTIDLGTDWYIDVTEGPHTYATTTTALVRDNYTVTATLVGDYGFTPPAVDCEPLPPFVTCSGVQNNINMVQSSVFVSLDNGTIAELGFQVGSTTSRNGLATTTCSVTQIGGCFQNALAFLFYPSPDVLGQFQFLWQIVKAKPPFGYVTQTISALGTLNASSTPAFTIPTLPLMDQIFTPLRTALAGLLWLLFGIAFYHRLKHIDL